MPPTTIDKTTLTLPTSTKDDDDIVMPVGPTFKIFSSALKAFEREVDGTSRKFLSCTASSTDKDLHGDYMTSECVQGMAPQAKNKGMTIFLNHSYKVPEDVFGKTVDSKIVARSGGAGETVWDLDLDIMLNESNQRALDTYAAIKDQGMKMGVSIGAMIEDYAFIDEEAGFWGGLEIKAVNLLEASIVGIPANQRSWVVNGLMALGAPKAVINKALGKTYVAPEAPEVTETVEVTITNSADADQPDPADDPATTSSASPEGETPDEETTSDDADASEGDTDVTAAADAVEAMKSAGADASLAEIVLGFLEGATEEVAGLRKQIADLTKERDDARQEVQRAAEIVETIAKTPLGRKAQFAGPVSTFRSRFAGYYDEGFLKLLEGDTTDE